MPASTPSTLPHAHRGGDAAIGMLDQGVVSAANFLTVIVVARGFTPHAFGIFMIVQTLLLLSTGLQTAIVTQPHNVLCAQRAGSEYVRLTLVLAWMQACLCICIAGVAVACGAVMLAIDRADYARLAMAFAIVAPLWMAQEFVRRTFYTRNTPRRAAAVDTLCYGSQLIGVAAVVYGFAGVAATPANALLAFGVAAGITLVPSVVLLRRELASQAQGQLPERGSLHAFIVEARGTWKLSKWLVAQQMVTWFGGSGHGWMLTALLGPASFGVYRAAYQVVNVLNPPRQAVANFLPSQAARAFQQSGREGLDEWVEKVSRSTAIPFAAAAVVVIALAEPLGALFYGQERHLPHLAAVVALGAIAYTINFARAPLDYAVVVAGGGKRLLIRSLWLTAFVCTAGAALIWWFGVVGALISELLAALAAAILTLRIRSNMRRQAIEDAPVVAVPASTPLDVRQSASRSMSLSATRAVLR